MDINLILNKTNLLAFKDLLKVIKEDEESVIIVPDKFSLNAELMYFEEKNITANFSMQVFSITKLASKVLSNKLNDKKIIDKNISLMIISDIINNRYSEFKYFKNIKDINSFVGDIFNTISQILSSNIKNLEQDINNNDKFYDIKLIFDDYITKREDYLIDASKKYDLFIEEIKNSSFIKNKHFYFAMFDNLTNQVKEIIKEILKYAKSVTFSTSFCENLVNNNEIYEFYKSLNPNIIKVVTALNEIQNVVVNNFFSGKKEIHNLSENKLKVFEAKTIEEEIENLAYEIKKDILTKNLRYKDISICCSDLNIYSNIISSKFSEFNFNFFLDENFSLINTSFAKFILDIVKFLKTYSNKTLITIIKNDYVNIEEKIKDNFVKLLNKYSISDYHVLNDFKILNKDKYYEDYLIIYNKVFTKLMKFKNEVFNYNVHIFFKVLNNLLTEFNSFDMLKIKTDYYLKTDVLKYKQFSQIENKIFEAERNICDYYKEDFNINKIYHFMELVYSNTNISVASTSVDSIFVGDYLNSYFKPCKKLYVIGANSRNFPKVKRENGLLTDDELIKLEKNIKISPKVKDINKINYFKCFQSLLCFNESLTLSYALLENGEERFPSNFVKNFLSYFKYDNNTVLNKVNLNFEEYLSNDELVTLLSLKYNNEKTLLKRFYELEENKEKQILKQILCEKYGVNFNEEPSEKIDKKLIKVNKFSSSSLEDYFSCPKRFLYKNIIKLTKEEPLKLDARIIGDIVHSCCYNFSCYLLKQENCDENIKKQIINNVFCNEKYSSLKILDNSEQILKNLKNEISNLFNFIENQQKNSKFKVSLCEYKFNYEENNINFKGFVDRIDINEETNEFIVIDYKTGSTKISYKEIVFNKKIQLLFYAKILEKILNKRCKGVYYLNVNDNFTQKEEKKIFLNGITVNTNNTCYNLDKNLVKDDKIYSEYFNFNEEFLLNENEFNKLMDYTYNNVLNAVKEINNANFSAEPICLEEKVTCDYCDYYSICKNKNIKELNYTNEMLKEIIND